MGNLAKAWTLSPEILQSISEEHQFLAQQVDLASLEIDKFFSESAPKSPYDVRRLVHILGELIETAEAHFHHEESSMGRDGFPDLCLHKRDHDDLLKRLNRLASSFGRGRSPVSAGIGADLRSWLTAHTTNFDDPYLAFAESRAREAGG
jgi:hemerythrin-like metal-binding protein